MFDRPELTRLKEAGPAECRYVVGHGQLTVEQNVKVVNIVCELYCGIRQSRRLCRDLTAADVFPAR